MKTKIIKLNPKKPEKNELEESARIIKKGGLVAFPTETVYGLGANGLSTKSVKKIFLAKGRPQDNPLILHVSDIKQVSSLVTKIPEKAKKLIDKFWPGPLTIILNKSKIVPDTVTCGLDSVAIRMPDHKIALKLIELSECPLAAPSANTSGKPSPTTAKHVIDDLKGKIEVIIDGGKTSIGLESTVIDLTKKIPEILRPGKITKKQIETVIGKIGEHKNKSIKKAKSPGMKYKHYSPNAKVLIANNNVEIKKIKENNKSKKIKILKYLNNIDMAKNLYKDFRDSDKNGYNIIIVKEVHDKDFGTAIMDRLNKAANNKENYN